MSGVVSAGFSTTVFPQASAGAIFHASISSGKFHGMIWPATPSGRGSGPYPAHASLSAQPAWWKKWAATSGRSTSRVSRIGLPLSIDSSTASSRERSCSSARDAEQVLAPLGAG